MELPVRIVALDPRSLGLNPGLRVLTSLEGENPGGSIKDRMVMGELLELLSVGELRAGDWIAEISAGTTARSLAYYCAELDLRCALFVPKSLPPMELRRLSDYGAEVHAVDAEGAFERFDAFCRERRIRPFNQTFDPAKSRHYHDFGKEICAGAGNVDLVIGGVGTGHSVLGTAAGMPEPPLVITAEPASGSVRGIRNVERERHGPADPCDPASFDRRVVLAEAEYFGARSIEAQGGRLEFSDSFRLVLGALSRALEGGAYRSVFLVGAENRFERGGDS